MFIILSVAIGIIIAPLLMPLFAILVGLFMYFMLFMLGFVGAMVFGAPPWLAILCGIGGIIVMFADKK